MVVEAKAGPNVRSTMVAGRPRGQGGTARLCQLGRRQFGLLFFHHSWHLANPNTPSSLHLLWTNLDVCILYVYSLQ